MVVPAQLHLFPGRLARHRRDHLQILFSVFAAEMDLQLGFGAEIRFLIVVISRGLVTHANVAL